jgi:hypothetical protein
MRHNAALLQNLSCPRDRPIKLTDGQVQRRDPALRTRLRVGSRGGLLWTPVFCSVIRTVYVVHTCRDRGYIILQHSLCVWNNRTSNPANFTQSQKNKNYPCNMLWRPIGLWDVEAATLSLDSLLTDGCKVVSLTRRPPFTPQKDSWYSFMLEAESIPGLGRLGKLKKKITSSGLEPATIRLVA